MSSIEDSHLLSELTLPGTHDSLSYWISKRKRQTGEEWAQTQSLTLFEQLDRGIRFLDIRCRLTGPNTLTGCHGTIMFPITFSEIVTDCANWLTSHPSECIVLSLKNEEKKPAAQTMGAFAQAAAANLGAIPSLLHPADDLPRLSDVRGRLILLRRFDAPPLGIDATHWPDDTAFRHTNKAGITFVVQDKWNMGAFGGQIFPKFTSLVEPVLRKASEDSNLRTLYLNFCNGMSPFTPAQVASTINPRLLNFVTHAPPGRYGVICMDFPEIVEGARLIRNLVELNAPIAAPGAFPIRPQAPDIPHHSPAASEKA
ncbi:hypothetical protein FHW69_003716 [Luteibacter sp. Sphag1AF]|uniref:phosphatidylinositol-specific phospholipase C n=1 Tax=Luteibacter sp. Sphag1AF TaxID=2587031 RepID=UPI00160BC83E|nr:phosphatidylinositol-specific phospholipase C [Luteibacter sp. Sphag1AF]MBB3229067.1 hypothetical protein [Luteibacter sp. Sphag1AF]